MMMDARYAVGLGAAVQLDQLVGGLLRHIPYVRSRASYVVRVSIEGRNLVVPVVRGIGYINLVPAEAETSAMLRCLIELTVGAVLDIGANVGQTLLKIKAIDAARPYIGLEPSPTCVSYLHELIRQNDFSSCTIAPVGASDHCGRVSLHYTDAADVRATLVQDFWSGANKRKKAREVVVERVDSLVSGAIGVAKIDVEGAELEVLAGMEALIAGQSPPILLEILPASCDLNPLVPESKSSVEKRLERLSNLTALLAHYELRSFRMLLSGELEETREFDSDTYDPGRTNYLLLPKRSDVSLSTIETRFAELLGAA